MRYRNSFCIIWVVHAAAQKTSDCVLRCVLRVYRVNRVLIKPAGMRVRRFDCARIIQTVAH